MNELLCRRRVGTSASSNSKLANLHSGEVFFAPLRMLYRNGSNFASYLCDGCLWPKADIETESKSLLLNVCFGEKSRHSDHDVTSAECSEEGGYR